MTRLLSLSLLAGIVPVLTQDLSKSVLEQILDGSGPASLDYSSKNVRVEHIYDNFPQCFTTCSANKPCASLDPKQLNKCTSPSTLTDASRQTSDQDVQVSYCPENTVCCHPSLCRPRVLNCSFESSNIAAMLEAQLDIEGLLQFDSFGSSDTIATMLEALTPVKEMDKECNQDCNNWKETTGDISSVDCPSTCRCSIIPQAGITASGEYVCQHQVKNNANELLTTIFKKGNSDLTKDMTDKRAVCDGNDSCLDAAICMTSTEYAAEKEKFDKLQKAKEEQKQKDAGADTSSSPTSAKATGLSTGAIIGIVVGCIVLIALVVFIVVYKKKQDSSTHGDYVEA